LLVFCLCFTCVLLEFFTKNIRLRVRMEYRDTDFEKCIPVKR
jgi:hypothetical protein